MKNTVSDKWLCEFFPLRSKMLAQCCFTLAGSLPPGWQVQAWDIVAADEPVTVWGDGEDVSGDGRDAGVVTDDPG